MPPRTIARPPRVTPIRNEARAPMTPPPPPPPVPPTPRDVAGALVFGGDRRARGTVHVVHMASRPVPPAGPPPQSRKRRMELEAEARRLGDAKAAKREAARQMAVADDEVEIEEEAEAEAEEEDEEVLVDAEWQEEWQAEAEQEEEEMASPRTPEDADREGRARSVASPKLKPRSPTMPPPREYLERERETPPFRPDSRYFSARSRGGLEIQAARLVVAVERSDWAAAAHFAGVISSSSRAEMQVGCTRDQFAGTRASSSNGLAMDASRPAHDSMW